MNIEITNSVEVFDIQNQLWSKSPNLPRPLAEFGYACTNQLY